MGGKTILSEDYQMYNTPMKKSFDNIQEVLDASEQLEFSRGKSQMQKEYTFTKKPLGLAIGYADNKATVTKMTNPACLKQGIVVGSQLLSVDALRWEADPGA